MTTTFIALLRAVNVGGNALKMERLRELLLELGLKNPRTYVQSGNVLFETSQAPSKVASMIEQGLISETRLPVSVFLKTHAQFQQIIADNPFLKQPGIDLSKLHVTFLSGCATPDAIEKLGQINAGPDRFHLADQHVYLHCPSGYGRTRLANAQLERTFRLRATTRNWNTVLKLNALAELG